MGLISLPQELQELQVHVCMSYTDLLITNKLTSSIAVSNFMSLLSLPTLRIAPIVNPYTV